MSEAQKIYEHSIAVVITTGEPVEYIDVLRYSNHPSVNLSVLWDNSNKTVANYQETISLLQKQDLLLCQCFFIFQNKISDDYLMVAQGLGEDHGHSFIAVDAFGGSFNRPCDVKKHNEYQYELKASGWEGGLFRFNPNYSSFLRLKNLPPNNIITVHFFFNKYKEYAL